MVNLGKRKIIKNHFDMESAFLEAGIDLNKVSFSGSIPAREGYLMPGDSLTLIEFHESAKDTGLYKFLNEKLDPVHFEIEYECVYQKRYSTH
ncbi:hypothetical protein [Catenovulum agarivorans]|nr:hypothetical protein [Catenovulum agarivorans]